MDGAQEATLEQGGSDTNDEGLDINMAKHKRRSSCQQVWTHWAMVIPKDSVPWYSKISSSDYMDCHRIAEESV